MRNDNVEVTRVSSLGIWLRARDKKFFLSYYDFPQFKHQPLAWVLHVEEPARECFHWPELKINLSTAAIEGMRAQRVCAN